MTREKMIALADKLIAIGQEIRNELVNQNCTIYFHTTTGISQMTWTTWQTDEEVIEWCEENGIKNWWR